MTTWARTEAVSARDELDELFPGRARRTLSSLAPPAFSALQQVGPRRWSTVSRCGDDVADWLQVSLESDPMLVRAEPGEVVPGAGELLAAQVKARADLAPPKRSSSKRGPPARRRTGS